MRQGKPSYNLGFHNFYEEARMLHASLKQFLAEPQMNTERLKLEAIALKRLLEDLIL
jgi:hypothetical protein